MNLSLGVPRLDLSTVVCGVVVAEEKSTDEKMQMPRCESFRSQREHLAFQVGLNKTLIFCGA